jgi:thioredoxin 1
MHPIQYSFFKKLSSGEGWLFFCWHFFYRSPEEDHSFIAEALMTELNHVSEDTFQADVLDATQPVLVDFTAVWCGPCKMLDPVVMELAQTWTGQVKVVKLDVDTNPNLAMHYQVMGVPTLLLFRDGQPIERVIGYHPKKRLEQKFLPHLG